MEIDFISKVENFDLSCSWSEECLSVESYIEVGVLN